MRYSIIDDEWGNWYVVRKDKQKAFYAWIELPDNMPLEEFDAKMPEGVEPIESPQFVSFTDPEYG